MADRTYVYIDGESHFVRSENAWRKINGDDACLGRLRYTGDNNSRTVLFVPKAKVFWTRRMTPAAFQSMYFTSAVVDDPALYQIQLQLKDFGLEPFVVKEQKKLAKQRENALQKYNVIEKPKGVDFQLAVRLLSDSFVGRFDVCHLYTSDVDFAPVIEAIRAQGKQVFVHGYPDGLGQQSKLRIVADQFHDLEKMMRDHCELVPQT
jgi:uncharacterized LabA/DUF88 family protein